MNTPNAVRARPAPLPAKVDDWDDMRSLKERRTLNDMVEDIHRVLIKNEEYRQYLEAVWDSDAVEGSLSIDNVKAAEMIRDKAKSLDGNEIATKKLDTIVKSLGVVLRRYEASRKERRHKVGGVVQQPADNNGE